MIPEDYNPHIHGKAPTTRVELLAWDNRYSTSFLVRRSAATILVCSGILTSHPASSVVRPKYRGLRRQRSAVAALVLRKQLRLDRADESRPVFLQAPEVEQSPVDVRAEARIPKPSRVNFHDA